MGRSLKPAILIPGCPSDICNRSEGEEGLSRWRLQMGRRGRQDGWAPIHRVQKALLHRPMPDQTECECGWFPRLRRSGKVHDLEPRGSPYPTYVFFFLPNCEFQLSRCRKEGCCLFGIQQILRGENFPKFHLSFTLVCSVYKLLCPIIIY